MNNQKPLSMNATNTNSNCKTLIWQIQSTHNIVSAISKQIENLQKMLESYNARLIAHIPSLSTINNNNDQEIINCVQSLINIQDRMWNDLMKQKCETDGELVEIKQQLLMNLTVQQQIILMDHQNGINNYMMQTQTQPILVNVVGNNNIPNNTNNPQMVQLTVNDINQGQDGMNYINPHIQPSINGHNNAQKIDINYNEESMNLTESCTNDSDDDLAWILATHSLSDNNISDTNPNESDEKSNILNTNNENNNNRGYDGPYSLEEREFMRDFNRNQTTEDIVALSNEMFNKFNVRRSPYALVEEMYSMGITNLNLKCLFQRMFENEGNLMGEGSAINNNNGNSTATKRRPFT